MYTIIISKKLCDQNMQMQSEQTVTRYVLYKNINTKMIDVIAFFIQ